MDSINQLLDFFEGCEHALVDLHPHFALVLVEMSMVPEFIQTVYRRNDLDAQVWLPHKFRIVTGLKMLIRHERRPLP